MNNVDQENTSVRKLVVEEIKLLQKSQHPNIVAAFCMYEDIATVSIIMELCTGPTIEKEVETNRPFTEAQAASCFFQIMDAVHYLHDKVGSCSIYNL